MDSGLKFKFYPNFTLLTQPIFIKITYFNINHTAMFYYYFPKIVTKGSYLIFKK